MVLDTQTWKGIKMQHDYPLKGQKFCRMSGIAFLSSSTRYLSLITIRICNLSLLSIYLCLRDNFDPLLFGIISQVTGLTVHSQL